MRISWLVGALITFIMGVVFTISIIGSLVGIPLVVISVLLLFGGIFLREKNKRNEVHHYHYTDDKKHK